MGGRFYKRYSAEKGTGGLEKILPTLPFPCLRTWAVSCAGAEHQGPSLPSLIHPKASSVKREIWQRKGHGFQSNLKKTAVLPQPLDLS